MNNIERKYFCSFCGTELEDLSEKICPVCGYNVFEPEELEEDKYSEEDYLEESLED
jgi:DNA-directed RNA polymerase subunit RPC12/RpoP